MNVLFMCKMKMDEFNTIKLLIVLSSVLNLLRNNELILLECNKYVVYVSWDNFSYC